MLLSLPDAADHLGVRVRELLRMIDRGDVGARAVDGEIQVEVDVRGKPALRRRPTFDEVLEAAVDRGLARRDDGTCLRLNEVAERLRISPNTVTQLIRSGELPVVTLGPKTKRVRLVDLVAYLDRHSSHRYG